MERKRREVGLMLALFFLSLSLSPLPPCLPFYCLIKKGLRPPLCTNRFINARKHTDCTGLGFVRVPDRRSQVNADTILLYLNKNNLTELLAEGFR